MARQPPGQTVAVLQTMGWFRAKRPGICGSSHPMGRGHSWSGLPPARPVLRAAAEQLRQGAFRVWQQAHVPSLLRAIPISADIREVANRPALSAAGFLARLLLFSCLADAEQAGAPHVGFWCEMTDSGELRCGCSGRGGPATAPAARRRGAPAACRQGRVAAAGGVKRVADNAVLEPGGTDRETADVETSSDGYAARFAGPVGTWLLEVQEAATLDLLAGLPGRRVLDVGGGHGQLTSPLLRLGYEVTVFGSAPSCADRIRGLLDGTRCRFEAGDLLDLPFPPRSFDIVLSFRLLPHVARWTRLVAELARVADRAVLVDFPTESSLNALAPRLFGIKKRLEGNTRPYAFFRQGVVVAAFAEHGFRLTGRRPEFALPMVLHRLLGRPALSARAEAVCRRLGLTDRWGSPVIVRMERAATATPATGSEAPCGS